MVGIDLSMRSTGLVYLNEVGDLVDFEIVANDAEDYLVLLRENISSILYFCRKNCEYAESPIALEGLSFGSTSSRRDVLAGQFWHLRLVLDVWYSNVSIYPVQEWRCATFHKSVRDHYKEHAKPKSEYLKIMCVTTLPEDVRMKFEQYINSSEWLKSKAIYDLADAYWMAQYGLKKNAN